MKKKKIYIYIYKTRRRDIHRKGQTKGRGKEEKGVSSRCFVTNKGERSHFSGMSGETPGDGWPSRGLLRGKHVQGALFARTKDRYFRRG